MAYKPFISVIIPVYNSGKTLSRCLEAVINQSYGRDKYEIIIVDNMSRDSSREIIKKFPVTFLSEDTIQSSYAARNKGIKEAKGDILAFTDADCIVSDQWLEQGAAYFQDPKMGCVAGNIISGESANYIEEYSAKKEVIIQGKDDTSFPYPFAKTANAFYRKKVFSRVGFFESYWRSAGDADLAWRMQIETDYTIKFASDTIVRHVHRSSLKALFLQSLKWGFGFTLLRKKYKNKIEIRTLKQTIWIFFHLFCAVFSILRFLLRNKNKLSPEEKNRYLDMISFAGWEIGRITGSIRNGVMAI